MDKELFEKFSALPRLNRSNMQKLTCKACDGSAEFFDIVDFNKCCSESEVYAFGEAGIAIKYYRCVTCGFIFTPFFDDWSPAEFARFVYNDDYIFVDGEYAGVRPEREAAGMAKRLAGIGKLRILDYGSGSGVFADHLRARGREGVVSYDPFSSPDRPAGRFDLITCYEVLEHSTSPRSTLSDIASLLEPTGCVIFSTGIQPANIGELRASWWYIAPRNGHASVYTPEALAMAAQAVGLTLHAGPGGLAFAAATPSTVSSRLLSAIGSAFQVYELTAPAIGPVSLAEQRMSWYVVEGTGEAAYRWTRQPEVTWRLRSEPLPPCRLTIRIPLKNEVQPGFADGCRLEIGGRSVPLKRVSGVLIASTTLQERTDSAVKLIMPPLLRPSDLGPVNDDRTLGLAISIKFVGR